MPVVAEAATKEAAAFLALLCRGVRCDGEAHLEQTQEQTQGEARDLRGTQGRWSWWRWGEERRGWEREGVTRRGSRLDG